MTFSILNNNILGGYNVAILQDCVINSSICLTMLVSSHAKPIKLLGQPKPQIFAMLMLSFRVPQRSKGWTGIDRHDGEPARDARLAYNNSRKITNEYHHLNHKIMHDINLNGLAVKHAS